MTITATERYELGPVEVIPSGEGRNFRLPDGREIAIFRARAGELFATQARCPHRGGPLADGLIGGGRVVCPFHGYAFDLTSGEPLMNSCPALVTYAVEVDGAGTMIVQVDPDSPQPCP